MGLCHQRNGGAAENHGGPPRSKSAFYGHSLSPSPAAPAPCHSVIHRYSYQPPHCLGYLICAALLPRLLPSVQLLPHEFVLDAPNIITLSVSL
jgi:hypothetical protein